MATKHTTATWKVHTGNLLNEILHNQGTGILKRPLQIFRVHLIHLGEIALRLNDPELNKLMCELTIYTCADPESPDYNPKAIKAMMAKKKIIISQ